MYTGLFNCINLYLNKALHFTFNNLFKLLFLSVVIQDLADLGLVNGLARVVELQLVFAAAHPEHFESVDLGNELGRSRGQVLRVHLNSLLRQTRLPLGKRGGSSTQSTLHRCPAASDGGCRHPNTEGSRL